MWVRAGGRSGAESYDERVDEDFFHAAVVEEAVDFFSFEEGEVAWDGEALEDDDDVLADLGEEDEDDDAEN